MYEIGLGVPKDYAKAADLYQKGADKESPSAEYHLGVMYEKGLGVAKDYVLAAKRYQKSADHWNADAQNKLGYLYEHGLGVRQNHSQAIKWYQKAADIIKTQSYIDSMQDKKEQHDKDGVAPASDNKASQTNNGSFEKIEATDSVYPDSANQLKPYDFGEAIKLFMLDDAESPAGWDYRYNSSIVWLTDGYVQKSHTDGQVYNTRNGLIRIHINGNEVTVLKRKKYELVWTVAYENLSNPNLQLHTIKLSAGTPNMMCFGATFHGCSFNPLPSLKNAGISYQKLCESKFNAQNFTNIYKLSYPSKQVAYGVWSQSGGSGGDSTSFRIVLDSNESKMCSEEINNYNY